MKVTDTIEKLLKSGQTVYVWYENGDSAFYRHPFTGTALKLVPCGDGLYTRHWRNEENTEWEKGTDYNMTKTKTLKL